MNYPCHPWLKRTSRHFHRFAKGKLKLKRERPLSVVRDGVRFYKALGRLRIDCEERRLCEIPEIVDDDFLLFWIPKIQAAHVDAVYCSGNWAFCCSARSGCRRRGRSTFRGAFFRAAEQFSTGSRGQFRDPNV